jgi:hypothetical protein
VVAEVLEGPMLMSPVELGLLGVGQRRSVENDETGGH